jgi:tetratricopeptide (TPR) repeat protein
LLDADSTDGFASLMMGRIAAKEGRSADAVSYFHRAIYGHWNDHESDNRQRARFELIDYLAAHNSKEELLAELLPVAEHPPRDIKSRAHLGQLFLMAGSPSHAADMFRTIVHDQPSSAEAHAGLAEADFARADYRSAQRNFQDALRFDPSDQAVRRRLDLCDELLQLDPTLRGIDSQERQQRSAKLVELTAAEVTRCVPENQSPELKILLGTAASASKARSSEANLDLAEQLWQARKKECRAAPDAETPLALVLARLAR